MIRKVSIATILKRIMKILAWIIASFFTILILASLLLLIPSVQNFVINKATGIISEKTNMKVDIGSIHIAFPKAINIGGIFIEDHESDTLFYCDKIVINTDLIPLIRQIINIDYLLIDGLKANIYKKHSDSSFNFSPLIDVFANPEKGVKEKSGSTWEFGFDELEFKNLKADFNNQIDSSGITLNLGHLLIESNSADVISGKLDIRRIDLHETSLSISLAPKSNSGIPLEQKNEAPELPFDINLEELNLNDIHFSLTSVHEELTLFADLHRAKLRPKTLDLKSFDVKLELLQADGVDVVLKIIPEDSTDQSPEPAPTNENSVNHDFTFGDFPWKFLIENADISNASYKMDLGIEGRDSTGIDYWHMAFSDFSILADSAYFNKNSAGAKVKELRVKEISGAELTHAEGEFSMDNQSINAINVKFSTPKSAVFGTASIGFTSLRGIGKYIEKLEMNSDLQGTIHIPDIKPFTSVLDHFPLLAKIDQLEVNALKVHGTLDKLQLENCTAGIGVSTVVEAKGFIKGLPSTDLEIILELDTLITSAGDLNVFLPDTLLPAQISLPENIGLAGTFQYRPDFMDGDLNLRTDFGDLLTEVQLNGEELSINFHVPSFDVGQVLKDSIYGVLELDGEFKGKQSEGIVTAFTSKIDIHSMDILENTFENIQIDMEKKDKLYSFNSSIDDPLLSFVAYGEALLIDPSNHYNLEIEVKNADLYGMNLLKEYLVISGNIDINTDFTSTDDIDGTFILSDIHLSNAADSYEISEIKLVSDIRKEYTNFNFTSDIFNSSLTGNTKIGDLKTAFNNHIHNYFTIPDSLLSEKEYHFEFDLSMNKPDFFTDFLFDELKGITIDTCHASYDSVHDLFEADIRIPQLKYANWELDDLSFRLNSEEDTISSHLELGQFSYDSAFVKNLAFSTQFSEQNANIFLAIHDVEDSLKYRFETNVTHTDSAYIISLNPEKLTIDRRKWHVDPNNKIIIKNRDIGIQSALLSYENQKIWLESMNDHLKLNIEQFNLQNITSILEKEEDQQLIKGRLGGYIDVTDLFGNPMVKSEFSIKELSFYDEILGNLDVLLDYNPQEDISYTLNLTNDANSIQLEGRSDAASPQTIIEATLTTDIAKAEVFSSLVDEYITDLQGGINGKIEIIGEAANPDINGRINFNDLSMSSRVGNASFTANGSLSIDNNLFKFNNFNIADSMLNKISVMGSIDARNFSNPIFDLKLTSPDFMLVNSKEDKSKTIIGKFFMGIDIDIQGNLSNMVVNSGFSINEKTDIMYKLPGKDLELITDEEIVVFTDFNDKSEAIVIQEESQFIGDSLISMISGIDLTVNLEVDPEAKFRIFIDPNSGDITSFKLNGNLQYKYNDTQRGHLTGLIELREGFYELSFYGLVKKKFVYDPGSAISWSGNVMDGEINLSARYEVKTNSVGLVSNEIGGSEKTMYNQRLPYEVILKINNQISYPTISFGIDLPERYKNDNPTIASKLNILEQPSMEAERNKQAFALLVGGTFIPENPDINDGSSGSNFATTAARNSVNAIMTQQLNNLTGQIIKGIDVDMGVNTFDDYASGKAETRTQLDVKVSKNMFNDRVSAEVESHIDLEGANTNPGTQSTAGMTEFAVSYHITKSGNYRIKAFRENAWDLFDGDIQNSGFAFIFVKEFDSLKRKQRDPESKMSNDIEKNDPLPSPE